MGLKRGIPLRIAGTGRAIPSKVVTNDDLSQIMDTSDEWIATRTGIRQRHVITAETTTSLSVEAAKKALDAAGMQATDIDVIICATLSQDNTLPTLACEVQAALGAMQASAFDLNAACSGFIYGLGIANAYLKSGMFNNVLLIGTEVLSKILNWEDRSTAVLFGDGSAAAVITNDADTMLAFEQGADGVRGTAIQCENAPAVHPFLDEPRTPVTDGPIGKVQMNGLEVYKFAVRTVPRATKNVLAAAGLEPDDIKYFLFHQANQRIIDSAIKRLKQPSEKFPINLDRYGNTSAASVAILLDEMVRDGKIEAGDKIVLAGFGGGLTWAACVIEWA